MTLRLLPILLAATCVFAQDDPRAVRTINLPVGQHSRLKVLSDNDAREALGNVTSAVEGHANAYFGGGGGGTLPLWSYRVTAGQNNTSYSGTMVGQSPTSASPTTTNVPVVLIPVILQITQGGVTYVFDPTQADSSCLGGSNTALGLTQQSPLFTPTSTTLNGVNVGTTQFADAILRGEFWSLVKSPSSPYHLNLNTTLGRTLTISVNAGASGNSTAYVYNFGPSVCGNTGNTNGRGLLAIVNINSIDAQLRSYISANGLNASQFPFFLLYNGVMANTANNLNTCCVLGYHSGSGNQTYGIGLFEGPNQTEFSGVSDIAAISHEINEWVNDPFGNNSTPPWGNLGQVSGCQSDFEDGDPLSGTLMPPIAMPNGFTYHVQELAFFSWFYGGTSMGAGGKYSSNGTFGGSAKLCPAGGTN